METETGHRREGIALLILRVGLAYFIFLWAVHKLITPEQYQRLAKHFDQVEMSLFQVYTMGGLQIALCVLAALGIFRYFSYGGLALMLIALILLIHRDHYSLGGWFKRRGKGRWWL